MRPTPASPKPWKTRVPGPAGSELSPLPMAACLFSLSFSTVLFTLVIFKLLSFFIMPSLFFDLLFIGFPVGAFLGARFFRVNVPSFHKGLLILLGAAVFSTVACLFCKHFDYLRVNLFEVEIPKLLGQIAAFTGLFIPYFGAYGLSEYIGYQLGREKLAGHMRIVYGLYLFGAAAAYLFLKWALAPLGVTFMISLALLGIAIPAGLAGSRRRRWAPAAAAAVLAILSLFPSVEKGFIDLYEGTSPQSSKDLSASRPTAASSVFQKWGRYSYCEIMWSSPRRSYLGLYNDFFQWEFAPGAGFAERSLGAVPLWITPPGGSVAIIGSGGGRQVRYGERFGFKRMLALEIEPAVIEAVRGPLAAGFDRVYEAPGVEVKVQEARSFMEGTEERFDLIYLPSVGGYPQMMLEPGNMIRTYEAFRTLRDRLTPSGILAIWYPAGMDEKKILTDQYVRTLMALDMDTIAYETMNRRIRKEEEFLILACRRSPGEPPESFPRVLKSLPDVRGSGDPAEAFRQALKVFFSSLSGSGKRTEGIAANPEVEPQELMVQEDPIFTPISDEKPFLAGNVRHIFSMEMVYQLFAVLGGVLCVASAAVALILRRRADPGIRGRSYVQVALVSVLIGANFLLAEHSLVLALFKHNYVFYDSLILGAIGFLILTGLGSILITPRLRLFFQALAALGMAVLLAFHLDLPARIGISWQIDPTLNLLLFAPSAFVTGSFFPGIFELSRKNPLAVFAMDAVGAAFGSLAAFFLPIAFGFQAFFVLAAAVFLLTTVACALFQRGLDGVQDSSPPAAGG